MDNAKPTRKAGRPREFCMEKALDTALHLFWRKGYEGTSLSDLTEAIGVNRPSLYAAFGSKAELFRLVLDRYSARCDPAFSAALAQPTARGVAEALLLPAPACTHERAAGCLLVRGALTCSDESEAIRAELASRREAMVEALRGRFEQAEADSDFPAEARPADMARYVVTVMNGMAVQAAGGAGTDDLRRVAEVALRVWPGENTGLNPRALKEQPPTFVGEERHRNT